MHRHSRIAKFCGSTLKSHCAPVPLVPLSRGYSFQVARRGFVSGREKQNKRGGLATGLLNPGEEMGSCKGGKGKQD